MNESRLRIEYLPLTALQPYGRNARTHSAEQVAQLVASVQAFGWTNPILADEAGQVIAGHGRLAAATKLGLPEVPVIRLEGLTDSQRRALAIADNKLALNAGWDEKLLVGELQGLGDLQDLVGFSADELLRLLGGNQGLTDPDEAPPVPAEPVTRPSDVWLLGPHRLVCGDATSVADVALALAGVVPHLMVTDPPYGVDFDPTWRKGSEKRTYMGGSPDKEAAWKSVWALFPGDVIYIWHASGRIKDIWIVLEELGFELRQLIIWNKMRFIIGRGDYSYNHDPCFYGVRKGKKSGWMGARNQPTVWDIAHKASDTNHGAQKPVECMRRPIENNSSVGQAVYDPFVGSGTTIIAAEMTGRACHALEISPAYVDCAIMRWQNFTGQQATLGSTGQTFAELVECRNSVDIAETPSHSATSGAIDVASTLPDASYATV